MKNQHIKFQDASMQGQKMLEVYKLFYMDGRTDQIKESST